MELREFISATLADIIGGVVDARKKVTGAIVAPNFKNDHRHLVVSDGNKNLLETVEFEVILTDKGVSEKSKGIGVSFGSFGLGYKNEKGGENTSSTKIKFGVPIVFPGEHPR